MASPGSRLRPDETLPLDAEPRVPQKQIPDTSKATWVEATVLGVSEVDGYALVQTLSEEQFVVREPVLGDLWVELETGKRIQVLVTPGPLGKVTGAKPCFTA